MGTYITPEIVTAALVTDQRRVIHCTKLSNMDIYMGNLLFEMTEDELRREFIAFVQAKSVSVMNYKYIGSGQLRGHSFVGISSKSEVETTATSLTGKTIRERVIEVVAALPLSGNKDKMSFYSKRDSRFSRRRP